MIYYVVVLVADVTNAMLNETGVLSIDNLRKSNDDTSVVFEISLPVPNSLINYVVYNHAECLELMSTEEWSN